MEIRLNKITVALALITAIYMVSVLYMPLGANCGLMQTSAWISNYMIALLGGAAIIFAVCAILRLQKKINNREFLLPLVALIMFIFFVNTLYFNDGLVSACSGTVLSDNWWEALNWINNNTDECAVVATYWDPGHFITGIAKRSVVFDGATQGSTRTVPTTENKTGLHISHEDHGINRVMIYGDKNVTTARIQDIATTLFTSNETLAINILKNYRKPGCDELYYIASSDLISKSQWWTYFSTWNPLNAPEFGQRYNYAAIGLESSRPVLEQNAIAYYYRLEQNSAIVIYETNNTLQPFLQQGGQIARIEKLFYFDREGNGQYAIDETAEVKGLLWLDPSRQTVVFISPELERSLFTQMFFFNGGNLENFELVNAWGGEVKLFRVKLD